MSKILGFDLGTNSIGWALVENDKIIDMGAQIFTEGKNNNDKSLQLVLGENKINKRKESIIKLLKKSKKILKTYGLSFLTFTALIMNVLFPEFWQLWLNLGFAGLIAILTRK